MKPLPRLQLSNAVLAMALTCRHRRPRSRPAAGALLRCRKSCRGRLRYLIVVGILSAATALSLGTLLMQKTWTYTSTLLYHPAAAGTPGHSGLDVLTLATLMKSRDMLEQLIGEFKLDTTPMVLDKLIDVDVPHGTTSLTATLRWDDPEQAEAMLSRLVEAFQSRIIETRRHSIDKSCDYQSASLERTRLKSASAREALDSFCNQNNIAEFDHDLDSLKTTIQTLEGDLHKLRHEQSSALSLKLKPAVLAQTLVAGRAEIEQTTATLRSTRDDLTRLKQKRTEYNRLAEEVSLANAARQRAETELSVAMQSRKTANSELTLVSPARPALDPVKSTRKKITLAIFAGCLIVLVAPVAWIDWRRMGEPPLTRLANSLQLPLLGTVAAGAGNADPADDWSRLAALRMPAIAGRFVAWPHGRVREPRRAADSGRGVAVDGRLPGPTRSTCPVDRCPIRGDVHHGAAERQASPRTCDCRHGSCWYCRLPGSRTAGYRRPRDPDRMRRVRLSVGRQNAVTA